MRDAPWDVVVLESLTLTAAFVVITGIAVATLFLLPLVVFVVEAVVVVLASALLIRPVSIEVSTEGPPRERHELRARGWRASRRVMRATAREIESGLPPTAR